MLTAKRINEYDVMVWGPAGRVEEFGRALRAYGLRILRVSPTAIQVSFDGHADLRRQLPPVGSVYELE